ncbi:MAG: hypothetical protein AMS15_06670 [Planctomycetes bacterium DG_23]|nr:MAG: hypothetical protein AMS15_06670 [Planctomycetes bacterium DG_23]
MSDKVEFTRGIADIMNRDSRYAYEAYTFVLEALGYTLRKIGQHRHVTGQELCFGIRDLGWERFGYLARTVFNSWGVRATEDFGQIVFNLVDAGLMGKTETDSPDDFKAVYDFREALEESYRVEVPWAKPKAPKPKNP